MTNHNNQKQPRILKFAYFAAMMERFGFIMLSFLLVLYVKFLFGYSDTQAFTLFGVFTALAFIIPAIGGYLADHVFGIGRCLVLGIALEATGICMMAIPNPALIPLSLALTVIGEGFFKTAPTDLMARAYRENDPRIDSGFTIYYMGINFGAVFSPVVGGFVAHYVGWHAAFLCAGAVIFLDLIFCYLARGLIRTVDSKVGKRKLAYKKRFHWLIGIVIGVVVCALLLSHTATSNIFFIAAAVLAISYFIYEIVKSPKEEKSKIAACILLILMGFVFYVFYFQFFTSINLFVNRSVQRNVLGITLPPLVFLSLDPLWIIIISPILATISRKLAAKNRDLAVTTKFPIGICITSLCFLTLSLSTLFPGHNHEISGLWAAGAIFLFALGELFVGALGVAMVTRIAPKRMYGVMMGTWFLLAVGLGGVAAGVTATLASVPKVADKLQTLHIYHTAFLKMGLFGLGAGILCLLFSPFLKKLAHL